MYRFEIYLLAHFGATSLTDLKVVADQRLILHIFINDNIRKKVKNIYTHYVYENEFTFTDALKAYLEKEMPTHPGIAWRIPWGNKGSDMPE